MPTMKLTPSIAATSLTENVLTGTDFEFLPYAAAVTVSLSQSAAGLIVDIKADNEDLAAGVIANVAASAGRVIIPDDTVFADEPCQAGARLKIRANNPTAGALTLNLLVEVEQLDLG